MYATNEPRLMGDRDDGGPVQRPHEVAERCDSCEPGDSCERWVRWSTEWVERGGARALSRAFPKGDSWRVSKCLFNIGVLNENTIVAFFGHGDSPLLSRIYTTPYAAHSGPDTIVLGRRSRAGLVCFSGASVSSEELLVAGVDVLTIPPSLEPACP
jgi:hypothetical protein